MLKRENSGFTLIELLAVIVILAIVAIIAVPAIINVIEDARQGSFKNSAYGIIKAAEHTHSLKTIKDSNPGVIKYTYKNGVGSSNPSSYKLEYKGDQPKNGTIIINEEGQITLSLHDGSYCVEKGYSDIEVTINKKSKEECDVSTESTFICGNFLLDSRDNNTYKTTKIGKQCWMAENLKYTGNGCLTKVWDSSAPHDACLTHKVNTLSENPGSYRSWTEKQVLYQWGAAMNGSTSEGAQGICPDSWHIPTDAEWSVLEGTVDTVNGVGDDVWTDLGWRGIDAGQRLKSSTYWNGTNTFGFNALPSGHRLTSSTLRYVGTNAYWWSSTLSGSNVWRRHNNSSNSGVARSSNSQASGFSVRCIQK